ncbi:TonB-dependent receptor [Lacimicrobium alkaliphilum]|uniref:TonB-dependent receptor n=1 Tax=Lacimicrobium alkaliphilum TaxID=1526571 RepID=A0ABQ1RAD9_9ALTE|nr:TonB-dependent receptor [Lacimicrobium alkaliphilum]GGD60264.1 TonB-dependent receptor [Lacimicrobium alkaliphilum]
MFVSKKSRLAVLVSAGLTTLTSAGALAQTSVNGDQSIEEVMAIASPIRDSQKAAIDAKKNATNLMDIISADTIGRFPDQNLADSLGRIPGLAIERDQGQARYINFRGAPFKYSPIAIDGMVIPGAENGRIARFDSFPAIITSRLEANKAITPAMPGDAVAGFINIETHDPFRFDGFSLALDLGLGEQQLGGGDIKKSSLNLSWSDDSWGFMLFGSQNSREQITDNRELDWQDDAIAMLDYRSYILKREDEALGGKIEYRFNNGVNRLFVSVLSSEFTDHEQRNQYVLGLADGLEAMNEQLPEGAPPMSLPGGTQGYVPLALVERMLEYGVYNNSTDTYTLGADFRLADWFVEARINQTETANNTFLPILRSVGGTAAVGYDISDLEDPSATLYAPTTMTGIPVQSIEFAADLVLDIRSNMDIDATKYKLDAEKNTRLFGLDSTIELGLQIDDRKADGYGMVYDLDKLYSFPGTINVADYDTDKPWHSDFTNGIGATYFDNIGLRRDWAAADSSAANPVPAGDLITLNEEITSVYAMSTTELSWGNMVYGVRIEQTDFASTGPQGEFKNDFTNVLPSLHLNWSLSADQKLRWSLTTGVSRPDYGQWRATTSVLPAFSQVVAGNPELEEENIVGTDISYEHYIGDTSMFSAAAFYRQMDKVIYVESSTVDAGDYIPPLAGASWSYQQAVNGNDGHLSGVELNLIADFADFMQMGALDGFGFSANLTLLDSEFETIHGETYSLPGTSDQIFNASLFYENHGLSIRLNYQQRDDWFTTTENVSRPEYWDGQERMDIAISYALPVDLMGAEASLYFNANNLTDAVDIRYTGSSVTPNQVERYGKRYLAGIRINF